MLPRVVRGDAMKVVMRLAVTVGLPLMASVRPLVLTEARHGQPA